MPVNLPSPYPDQTIESWAALIWQRNGWANWPSASKVMFGSAIARVNSPWHGAFPAFLEFLEGAAYTELGALKEAHGYLPLLKPFLPPASYAKVLASNAATGPRSIAQGPLGHIIKSTPSYCPTCVSNELEQHGLAYLHRSHQVLGVAVCAQHGDRLATVTHRANEQLVSRGLLPLQTEQRWHLQFDRSNCPVSEGLHCYAAFVAAAMNGQLHATSADERLALFAERLGVDPKNGASCRLGASLLAKRIDSMFELSLLEELNVKFLLEIDAHMPSVLLGKADLTRNPLANLLVMATLFSDPKDFSSAAQRLQKELTRTPQPVPFSMPTPFGLIKDLFRVQAMREMHTKYGVSHCNVIAFLHNRYEINMRRQVRLERAVKIKAFDLATELFTRTGRRELMAFANMRRNAHERQHEPHTDAMLNRSLDCFQQ